jgi:hypothetical protein
MFLLTTNSFVRHINIFHLCSNIGGLHHYQDTQVRVVLHMHGCWDCEPRPWPINQACTCTTLEVVSLGHHQLSVCNERRSMLFGGQLIHHDGIFVLGLNTHTPTKEHGRSTIISMRYNGNVATKLKKH